MVVGAILSVLLPLSRPGKGDQQETDALDVYREQLKDLEQQDATSPDGKEILAVERTEIVRRVLKESRRAKAPAASGTQPRLGRVFTSLAALVLLPVVSLLLYSVLGSPGTPDYPLSAQRLEKLEDKSIEEMVRIAERHLKQNPDDAKGWNVLANAYGRLNRPADRAQAFEQIIRISGPTPDRLAELGEALTVADGNVISDRARKLFETAWAQDKTTLKASVYLAMASEQEGRFDKAIERWKSLAQQRKDDPQWQAMTSERLTMLEARLGDGKFKGPSAEDIKDASELNASDQLAMIESMVTRLSGKLEENPSDFTGWTRLIRSYSVLNRTNDAAEALKKAKLQFKDTPDLLEKLNKLAVQMKILESPPTGETN